MYASSYNELFRRARAILGNLTPLRRDCGWLCGKACCRGDQTTGMRLFPHETSVLTQIETADGGILATCNGTCDRAERPLACRIFPLFPYIHEDGHISAELDLRGMRVCPMITYCDIIHFDPDFLQAVRKVGRLLSHDPELYAFLKESSAEIDLYRAFWNNEKRLSLRKRGI